MKIIKQKKLIIAIAIILIILILAIVINENLTRNAKILKEEYFGTIANANSDLVASYIKEGISIGGIIGTLKVLDTSDATASAKDIAWGKTAYVNGVKIIGKRSTLDTVTGNEAKNSYVYDKYGNQVVVPAGFSVVNPYEDVSKGIVIEDISAGDTNTIGSQFVWIPVGNIITDEKGSTTTITLGRYDFDETGKESLVQSSDNWSDTSENIAIRTYYKELVTSTYENATAKNLEDFITKTIESGGYYIGRYEIGDAYATGFRNDSSSNDNPATCKSGVYPYTYISQLKSSSLCQKMYNNDNFESDLINSYTWDTAIVFIQKFSGDTDYSIQTKFQSTITKCGEAKSGTNYDVRCNIYDMAGNLREWSTETVLKSGLSASFRGGYYDVDESYVSYRPTYGSSTTYAGNYRSARPIIYL